MRWSENQTCQFVQLYLNHEYLWNRAHEHYKLKDKRLNAYKDIMAQFKTTTGLSLTVGELKFKIKSLRSTYSQELLKIKQRSSPSYTYKPTIKWFAAWHKRFENQMRANRSSDSFDDDDNDNDITCEDDLSEKDTSKVWVNSENINNEVGAPEEDLLPEHIDFNIIVPKLEPEDGPVKNDNISRIYVNRKKIKRRTSSTTSDGTFQGSMDSSVDGRSDEFDIYGTYIACQLRHMNLKKALRLQLQIHRLVSEARLLDL